MKRLIDQWHVPKMWEGSTVYVLGGGNSLLKEELHLIEDQRVIGVNCSFLLGDWVDVCWWGDPRWFDWNKEKLSEFGGLKVCCCESLRKRPEIKVLRRGKPMGFDLRSDFISWNLSSGVAAINLAFHFGAKRIVLLGFDMSVSDDGENNWHDLHKVKDTTRDPYPRFLEAFPHIKRDAATEGVEIINSTMCSMIPEDIIPKKALVKVIHENFTCI
ncbi:MAG: hypothetical protein GY821_12680 [Gammaproteobacteria bacterium]|nr:hypothetical protein [Gammaproteobacteria bacterium]